MNKRKLIYYGLYLRELLNFSWKNRGIQEVFTRYYKTNFWGSPESLSGRGSSAVSTEILRPKLAELLKRRNIRSIFDVPCGDYNWMKLLEREGVSYIGADVVAEMITENNRKYGDSNTEFLVADITKGPLPKVDLVLTRDCLVHLAYKDIVEAVRQIKASGSTYLLTTSFANWPKNLDIKTGHWRPINLSLPPFNFPEPIEMVFEASEDKGGALKDKSLNLYGIKDL